VYVHVKKVGSFLFYLTFYVKRCCCRASRSVLRTLRECTHCS